MTTALLLLEIQNDYFPNGRIPLEKSQEASTKAQHILQAFREEKLPIFHVQHISTQPDAKYFLPCTRGAAFHPHVEPMKGESVIKKHYPNAFKDTALKAQIKRKNVTHLVVCGMMSQSAVDATVRAALDLGLICTVIHDACAANQLEFNHVVVPAQHVHAAAMTTLASDYAKVMSSDQLLQRAPQAKPEIRATEVFA